MTRQRLQSLTGLRGVAAFSVLVAHAMSVAFGFLANTPEGTAIAILASQFAYFGMSLFFVLSGFVIHYNYSSLFADHPFGRAAYRFLAARFARLFPLYLITIGLALPTISAAAIFSHPGTLLMHLTLTQSWFNGQNLIFAPAWSISTEWFFYFAFLAIAPVLWRIVSPVRALVLTMLAAPLLLLLAGHFQAAFEPALTSVFWIDDVVSAPLGGWLWYYAPYIRIAEFLVGVFSSMTFSRLLTAPSGRGRWVHGLLGAAFLWCAVGIVLPAVAGPYAFGVLNTNFLFAPAIGAVMVAVCLRDAHPVSRLLSTRPAVFAGEISYSLYMFQMWAIAALSPMFARPDEILYGTYFGAVLKIGMIAGFAVLVAAGSYWLIEMPSRKFLRRVLMDREQRIEAAEARTVATE